MNKLRKLVVLIVIVMMAIVAGNVFAAGFSIEIPRSTVIRGSSGERHTLANQATGLFEGQVCEVQAQAENNSSVHLGNDMIVSSNGSNIVLPDVERAPGATTPGSGTIQLGNNVTVVLVLGAQRPVFSGGITVTFDCVQPTEEPTEVPTVEPTEEPTIEPTEEVPTGTPEPTIESTEEPTEEPKEPRYLDVCPNIEGDQPEIPGDHEMREGKCLPPLPRELKNCWFSLHREEWLGHWGWYTTSGYTYVYPLNDQVHWGRNPYPGMNYALEIGINVHNFLVGTYDLYLVPPQFGNTPPVIPPATPVLTFRTWIDSSGEVDWLRCEVVSVAATGSYADAPAFVPNCSSPLPGAVRCDEELVFNLGVYHFADPGIEIQLPGGRWPNRVWIQKNGEFLTSPIDEHRVDVAGYSFYVARWYSNEIQLGDNVEVCAEWFGLQYCEPVTVTDDPAIGNSGGALWQFDSDGDIVIFAGDSFQSVRNSLAPEMSAQEFMDTWRQVFVTFQEGQTYSRELWDSSVSDANISFESPPEVF